MKKTAHFLLFVLTIATLLLSACGGVAPTPTASVGGGRPEPIPAAFIGMVDSIAGDQWVINGNTVTVSPDVIRNGPYQVGDQVKVEGVVNSDGSFTVSRLEVPTSEDLSGLPAFGGAEDSSNSNTNDSNTNDANANEGNSNTANSNDDNGNGTNINDDNSNDVNSNDDNGNEVNTNDDNGNDSNSNDDNSNADNSNDSNTNDDNSNAGGGNDNGGGQNENGGGGNDNGGGDNSND